MSIQEAQDYINLAFKEGFLSDIEAEKILNLKPQLLIRWAERTSARGDAYVGGLTEQIL